MGKAKRKADQPVPADLTPLLASLQALQNLITQFNNRGVIIGGIAASLLGAPRYTADLDAVFLLDKKQLPGFLNIAAGLGIEPRIPDATAFARKNRVLLLRHTASGTNINLSMGILPFEVEMIEQSHLVDLGAIKLRLPTPEDLIILKAVTHSPKDLADIQAIAESHPELDKERIRYWVQQFGAVLDMPDIWNSIAPLF